MKHGSDYLIQFFLEFFLVLSILHIILADETKKSNTTTAATEIEDPFEADGDLRFAADTFCRGLICFNFIIWMHLKT